MILRTFFADIVCGFIPGKERRNAVRVKIKYHDYLRKCKKFALKNIGGKKHKIRVDTGRRSNNLIVLVDNIAAFKFPLHDNGYEKATREKRIIDAFTKISPIKIPKLDIIQWNNITVRKYEFTDGVIIKKIDPELVNANRDKLASQIANFLYTIGCSDPIEICDLKPAKNAKPDFLYGWFHNDIAENFTVDPKTMNIKYFIDWEDTSFCDFRPSLKGSKRRWGKYGFVGLMDSVMDHYTKLYKKSAKHG